MLQVFPDFGWGVYNSVNHIVTGDSLFIIKTVAGSYKKLHIISRDAVENIWLFIYSDLDGSNLNLFSINGFDYGTKDFVYYSLDSNVLLDREPPTSEWDLLFTRYFDHTITDTVPGVITNETHVNVHEVNSGGIDQATYENYEEGSFVPGITTIGTDWQSFNMGTFKFDVSDQAVFFLKKYTGEGQIDSTYYKIYFTGFGGYSDGSYDFIQKNLSGDCPQ